MKFAISAESTIDLSKEMLKKYDIHILHFHVQCGDKEGYDYEFTNQGLYDFTNKTGIYCHTSACNIDELERHFADLFAMGYEKIIHFTISSGLSSGYNNAMAAKGENHSIEVVDTHGTSGSIANLAIYASELREAGYSFEEVNKMVRARVPFSHCSFQLDRLDFLYKGGRCSKLTLLGANLLKIKPEIHCDEAGKFYTGKKHRGASDKCIDEYVDGMFESYKTIDKKRVFINYSTATQEVIDRCVAKAKAAGFEEIYVFQACPTNSYHSGPNVLGVQFFTDGPHPIVKK